MYRQTLFSKAFKQANVIPLYKAGDNTDPSNYRPLSIITVLLKPLEKHINKHILSHLKANQLLHPNQSGFRDHHSCHTALTTLVDKWHSNINNGFWAVVFVDFAKAFDVIDHVRACVCVCVCVMSLDNKNKNKTSTFVHYKMWFQQVEKQLNGKKLKNIKQKTKKGKTTKWNETEEY